MSAEEIEYWRINVLEKSIDIDSTEWHRRALLAMQSSVRRDILILLKDKALTIVEIISNLKLEEKAVQFHLQFLKQTLFITIEGSIVDLTPFGFVYLKNVIR
ncbi:MAG: ArsR family transcriptional regulator [Candidatus Freyarchaeum deiterrae]